MAKIGIDFGTSYTTVSHIGHDGKPEAIRINGNEKIPTILYYSPDGGEPMIGEAAFGMYEICRNLEDQEEIDRHMAGMFSGLKRNMNLQERLYLPDGRDLSYSDMIGEFFRYIKTEVEDTCYNGERVTDVCITYPVAFENYKKEILKDAAHIAGFTNVRLLMEPVAASMGFEQSNNFKGISVLVYDFGGGTFDLAFVKFDSNGDHITLPPMGNPNCGGENIDRILYDEWDKIVMSESRKHITDIEDKLDVPFLKTVCMRQKEFLCDYFRRMNQWTYRAKVAGSSRTMPITKELWNSLISPVIDQTIELTKQMLAAIEKENFTIDKVILIGGSSKIPLVRERLTNILPVAPQPVQDSDIAVAKGAAIFINQDTVIEKVCYCRRDGRQLSTQNKFCPYCGTNNIRYDYRFETM